MKHAPLIVVLLAGVICAQPQSLRVGSIDFYGYTGLDLDAIRARVPIHEGDTVSQGEADKLKDRIKQAAEADSVDGICCDNQGALMIYIGLRGRSARDVPYNSAPLDSARLPQAMLDLDRRYSDALQQAVRTGASAQDWSKGYALSADPTARALELKMRNYALHHRRMIERVLQSSSDAGQRAVAAELMGYARQSRAQITALVRASRDPEDDVRNNATRALGVLAMSSSRGAAQIPATGFIEMLYSRVWTDRNKAGFLLGAITRSRDPKLLAALRAQALDALLEMARWRDPGHNSSARMILGRCAGIPEDRLAKLVEAGDLSAIVNALQPLRATPPPPDSADRPIPPPAP